MLHVRSTTDLSALVKTNRKKHGLTQAQLAKMSGIKPLWISQFERGKTTVQLDLVLRVLRVLDVRLCVENTPSYERNTSLHENVVDLDKLLDGRYN